MFILHFVLRFKYHRCPQTFFFLLDKLFSFLSCYFLMVWKFHIHFLLLNNPGQDSNLLKPMDFARGIKELNLDARPPTITCSKPETAEISIQYKSRLAGGCGVVASHTPVWTARSLYQKNTASRGTDCTPAEPLLSCRLGGLRHRDGTRCDVRICSLWSPPAEHPNSYKAAPAPCTSSDLFREAFKAHRD